MKDGHNSFASLDVQALLPQSGTMALIRRVLEADLESPEPWVRAEVLVGPEALVSSYGSGSVLAPVGIEYVAQAGAVLGALLSQRQEGERALVRAGMIGAVREVQIVGPEFRVGDVLHVVARLIGGDESISSIAGEVYAPGGQGEAGLLMRVRCTVVHGL